MLVLGDDSVGDEFRFILPEVVETRPSEDDIDIIYFRIGLDLSGENKV